MTSLEVIKSAQIRCKRCITAEKAYLEASRIELEIDSDLFDRICTAAQNLKFWLETEEFWSIKYQQVLEEETVYPPPASE